VATSMGLLNFAYKTVDDIDFLHAALEFVEERNRVAIREVLIPLGVDAVLFDGDCAYRNGLMVSPRIFRELTHNRTAATVALLRQAGIPYVFHSDGQLDDVIPMLVELDFSAVHGIEALANDLSDIKRRFGRAITLIGNMDITFLGMSSVEQVREATRRMLDIGAPGGRYVAACNTSPEDFIPVENYSAFVEEIHAYAG
jgi:uroporphyrinogen decarboxylase